jgi:glutathione S-transferase
MLAVALYFFFATRVAAAHGKFAVRLPARTGNPDFERNFRARMNTLEWMPTFLAPLWLCTVYFSVVLAAALGLV